MMTKKNFFEFKTNPLLMCEPKETLKIFGGNLSIKDFRMYNTNYAREFKIIKPPMISIIPQQEFKCVQKKISHKLLHINNLEKSNELLLKRSKPYIASKNTLEKCMNLKCKK